MNPVDVLNTGPCQHCHRVVTRASWCHACQAFLCWRCEGMHIAYASKIAGHPRCSTPKKGPGSGLYDGTGECEIVRPNLKRAPAR